jgi:hypothetical protein
VIGQLHAPAALLPGKEPQVPIGQEAGWPPEPAWTLQSTQKSVPLPRIEPRFPGRLAHSLITILTELSQLHTLHTIRLILSV